MKYLALILAIFIPSFVLAGYGATFNSTNGTWGVIADMTNSCTNNRVLFTSTDGTWKEAYDATASCTATPAGTATSTASTFINGNAYINGNMYVGR